MSDDTDKLAAEMQNLRPSQTSRESGIGAAMAAFNQEFATEKTADKTTVSERSGKSSESSQGLADAPRPTGTRTKTVQVMITRREATMAKLTHLFNIKPQTMMMAGSCAAALMAAMIVLPNMDELSETVPAVVTETVSAEKDVQDPVASLDESPEVVGSEIAKKPQARVEAFDEITVTGRRSEGDEAPTEPSVQIGEAKDALPESAPPQETVVAPPPPGNPLPAPRSQGAISSVDALLSDMRQKASNGAESVAQEPMRRERTAKFQQQAIVSQTPLPALAQQPAPLAGRTKVVIPGYVNDAPAPTAGPEKIGGLTLEEVPAVTGDRTKETTVEYIEIPAEYETVTETVVVQEATTELVTIPPTFNPDGTIATPARTTERTIPSVSKTETRRRIKTPARTVERIVSPKYILRDDDGNVVREFKSRDAFEAYKAHLPTPVAEKPVSTFSIDVDTSSYSFLRASINRGQLPPRSSIRLEEIINYFPYDYDAPKSADEPFKANVTVTSNPWNEDTKLMHIGIKGYVPKQTEKPRSNLVFLIDTSGSMNRPNKLPLLINSFKLLLNTLDEDDTVSIVAYAGASGTVLEPTAVKNKSEILAALNNLRAGGSTAGAAGLELAYQKAQESFDDEGVNRVILATDGDFNVGFSSPDDMKAFIQKKRKTGIFLSVLGFGMGNYNDHLMQSLAQNGNGVAAYIDNLSEANKVLANEAGSALFTIAKDVKIQVEFNPDKIAEYRLIGYETRALKRQDFNNDKVDAGEIGAGHSVTAIYEMTPVGSPAVTVDKLRYVSEEPKTSTGSDEYAFVKIRHKLPDADKSTLQTFPISKRQERSMKRASDDMRFATAVAIVGQKLRGDTAVEDYSYEDAIKLAKSAKGKDENGYRAEFIQMVQLIDSLGE